MIQQTINLVAKAKNYITRANGWTGIINTLVIGLTYKQLLGLKISAIKITIIFTIAIIVFGYIDHKYIFPAQMKHSNTKNDMKKDLQEIKELIKCKQV